MLIQNRLLPLFFILLAPLVLHGQSRFTGKIVDKKTGESLIGASIAENVSGQGVFSNASGFFSLSLPKFDSIDIAVSYVGYGARVYHFDSSDTIFSFYTIFLEAGSTFDAVEVTASKNKSEINKTGGSTIFLNSSEIAKMPTLLGDVDPMRTFQLMPGISSGNEGTSGLLVRGGSSDQNLYLLDNVPIYNVNHLGGFLSIFDNESIKSMQVIKGGFPARYGGRISSVVDVKLKEGSPDSLFHSLLLGFLSSRYSTNGPLGSKTTFNFSIRRSMLDIFTRYLPQIWGADFVGAYTITDGTMKLTYQLDEANKLSCSFYGGNDHFLTRGYYRSDEQNQSVPFEVTSTSDIKWGNLLGAFKWQRQISSRWYRELALSYTQFNYLNANSAKKMNLSPKETLIELKNSFKSNIKDLSCRMDYKVALPATNNLFRFGGEVKALFLKPNLSSYFKNGKNISSLDTVLTSGKQRAGEFALYVELQFSLLKRLNGNIGMRSSLFSTEKRGYYSLQPRWSIAYDVLPSLKIKASYAAMEQNLHLLTTSGVGFPTDLWVAATKNVPPQKSQMINLGLEKAFDWKKITLEIDAYFKRFKHLISFSEGASFFTGSADWQQKVEVGGQGTAYGLEVLLRKEIGRNTGWISYTLSKNTRQFEHINNGISYPFRYDRRHDLAIVLQRKLSENIFFSGSWIFQAGTAITLPEQQFKTYNLGFGKEYDMFGYSPTAAYDFQTTYYYSSKNNFRMPNYHRLDINFRFEKSRQKGKRIWNVGFYNLYSRLNPLYIYFDKDKAGNVRLQSFSIFPILPSISYQRIW